MDKKFPVILEKKDTFFYCSIPELELVCKSENPSEAFEKIQFLKNERVQACNDYETFCGLADSKKTSSEDKIKKWITITFFLLLILGITSHIASSFVESISKNTESFLVVNSLKNLSSLTPEGKAEKVKRFQEKIIKARKVLKEAKPFIEASKPLLKDLQESFDLKTPRP